MSETDGREPPKRKKTRGPTTCKELTKRRGQEEHFPKRTVDFDANDAPIGPNKDIFVSYIGTIARTNVRIDIPNWRQVPDVIKDNIWRDILTKFDLPESRKKLVLNKVGERWRGFKAKLTRDFVTEPHRKPGVMPYEFYPFIEEEVWKKFKADRESEAFKKLSAENKERQKKNECPHLLGRNGYAKLRQEYYKKQLEVDAKFGTSVDSSSIKKLSRDESWILARTNTKGQILHSKTREVVEKIKTLKAKVNGGEFEPQRYDDVLSRGIGTKEHPGRTRGIGGHQGLKKYFGPYSSQNSGMMSLKDVEALTQRIAAKVREDTLAEARSITIGILESVGIQVPIDFEVNMASDIPTSSSHIYPRTSCHSVDSYPFSDIHEGVSCELAISSPEYDVVARGRVFPHQFGELVHQCPLSDNHVKVCIDIVYDGKGDLQLPVPFGDNTCVVDAQGSFCQWPKILVLLRDH